uniref:Endoribonuclease L-PSP n=1 Tax=Panagrellus redivivus TaxID=6233 RepID=A0A7E4UW03_PANRE
MGLGNIVPHVNVIARFVGVNAVDWIAMSVAMSTESPAPTLNSLESVSNSSPYSDNPPIMSVAPTEENVKNVIFIDFTNPTTTANDLKDVAAQAGHPFEDDAIEIENFDAKRMATVKYRSDSDAWLAWYSLNGTDCNGEKLVVRTINSEKTLEKIEMITRPITTMSSAVRQIISTENAPASIGPYSQAVRIANTIYISGSLGVDPATGNLVGPDTKAQAHQALKNIGAILQEAGVGFGNVVKTTVRLADMNDLVTVNAVYTQYFVQSYPARAAYQVARLPQDGRIEIEAIAYAGPITKNSA